MNEAKCKTLNIISFFMRIKGVGRQLGKWLIDLKENYPALKTGLKALSLLIAANPTFPNIDA